MRQIKSSRLHLLSVPLQSTNKEEELHTVKNGTMLQSVTIMEMLQYLTTMTFLEELLPSTNQENGARPWPILLIKII